jgi:hypothetical protein
MQYVFEDALAKCQPTEVGSRDDGLSGVFRSLRWSSVGIDTSSERDAWGGPPALRIVSPAKALNSFGYKGSVQPSVRANAGVACPVK